MSYQKLYQLKNIGKDFKDIKDKLPTIYGGNSDSNIINTLLKTTAFENIYFNTNSNIDDSYNIKINNDIYDTYSSNIYNLNLFLNNNHNNTYNFTINNYDSNINYYFNYIKIQNNIIDSNIDISSITINSYSNNNFDQTIENNYYYNNSDFNNINIDNSNIIINIDTLDQYLDYRIDLNLIEESKTDYLNKNLIFQNKIDNNNNDNLNKIIFKNDGSVGIGTNITHNYSLYVNNISNTKKGIYCADDITILSDINFKKDIKTIVNPIDKLINLRGVTYKRIDRDDDNIRYGFIAQEVQKILPEACDGEKGIKQIDIVALVVETIKELIKKNNLKI